MSEQLARRAQAPACVAVPPEDEYRTAVERYHGCVRMPVGIAGPVLVHGDYADGRYPVPMATTEGALVASYHRGCVAINRAGGCDAIVVSEAMTRTPCFRFTKARQARAFAVWASEQRQMLESLCASTSRHCRLTELAGVVEGNNVFLSLGFYVGDAAGQNMVTIATEAICRHLAEYFPDLPEAVYVEANLSGDKKASAQALTNVRGKRVVAEVRLDAAITERIFGCSIDALEDQWYTAAMGAALSGSVGLQGHYANALAAIYIALGQDAACTAESAVGVTRMQARGGELYASVTLPNVIVGCVGGGSALTDQANYLDMLGLGDDNPTHALAEIIGAACLAGELSIAGSIAAGTFARAHRILGRRRQCHVN